MVFGAVCIRFISRGWRDESPPKGLLLELGGLVGFCGRS